MATARTVAVTLLLAGCAAPETTSAEMAAASARAALQAPPPPVLEVTAAMRGEQVWVRAEGLPPDRPTYVFGSVRGEGSGPCASPGSPCLDLVRPALLTSGRSRTNGVFIGSVTLPAGFPFTDVWLQAATLQGTTQVVHRVVDDGDLDGLAAGDDCDDTVSACTTDCDDADADGERDCDVDLCVDVDLDGRGVGPACVDEDCDDTDDSVHPGAPDPLGDGVDQDCDGVDGCGLGDGDGDGVCDAVDVCVGDDATGDADGDGTCADLDACPADPGAISGSCADVSACAGLAQLTTQRMDARANDVLWVGWLPDVSPWGGLYDVLDAPVFEAVTDLGGAVAFEWTRGGVVEPYSERVLPWQATQQGDVWRGVAVATFLDGSTCRSGGAGVTIGAAEPFGVRFADVEDTSGDDGCVELTCRYVANDGDPTADVTTVVTWWRGTTDLGVHGDVFHPGQMELGDGLYGCSVEAELDGVTVSLQSGFPNIRAADGPTDLDDDGICNVEDACATDPGNDVDDDGICDDVEACEAIAGARIAPPTPTTDDVLSVLDGADPVVLAGVDVRWASDAGAAVSGPLVDASLTSRDETWTVDLVSTYPGEACVGFDLVTIGNSLPTVDGVTIAPATPDARNALTCTASGVDDADGDVVTLAYRWEVDGVVQATTASQLPAGSATRGQVVTCRVTPDDGTATGASVSAAVTLRNAPPTIVSQPTTAPQIPAACGETYTCTDVAFADADGDALTITHVWYLDDEVALGETSATLERALPPGTSVICGATASDGLASTGLSLARNAVLAPARPDGDGDGVCDAVDVCLGDDALGDLDLDGVCDDRDACLGDDALGDLDLDGVCDDLDACAGDDASGDTDIDGVCDDLDACLGDDAVGDSDLDGVCDDLDACPLPGDLAGVADLPDVRAGSLLACTPSGFAPPCAVPPEVWQTDWAVNGTWVATSATLDTTPYAAGDTVTCTLTATRVDGSEGTPVTSAPTSLRSSTWTLFGTEAEALAGVAVSVLGDLDGDGRAELAVGAPNAAPGGLTSRGTVFVVRGVANGGTTYLSDVEAGTGGFAIHGATGGWDPDTTVCLHIDRNARISCRPKRASEVTNGGQDNALGDGLGVRLGERADVDGDGLPDLVVSAPHALAHGQYGAGAVYVVPGWVLQGATTTDIEALMRDGAVRIEGAQGVWPDRYYTSNGVNDAWNAHLTGYGLATVDADADGLHDIVIGTPKTDVHGADSGMVTVLRGRGLIADAWLGDVDQLDAYRRYGRSGFWLREYNVASTLGDFDGDGLGDVYVGAGSIAVDEYVLLGSEAPEVEGELDDLSRQIAVGEFYAWSGDPRTFNWLNGLTEGRAITSSDPRGCGDVNADGVDDFVVPWIVADPGGNHLEVSVFFGGPGRVPGHMDALEPAAGIDGFAVQGAPYGFQNGLLAGHPGDLDGDGFDEVAFAYHAGGGFERIYVVWGSEDTALRTLADLDAGVGGFVLTSPGAFVHEITGGDVDGDGLSDLVWGGPYDDTQGNDAGRVDVWFGRDLRRQLTHAGTDADEVFTGGPGVDLMTGGLGDDLLQGGGGSDALSGGGGDDVLAVDDLTFRRVDGGEGFDTLRYGGSQDLDVGSLGSRLRSIEALDLVGGGHRVTVTRRAVANLSVTSNTLQVTGSSGDELVVEGGTWVLDGVEDIDGTTFRRIVDGEVVVLVEDELRTFVAPTLLTTTASIEENPAVGAFVAAVLGQDPDHGAPPTVVVDLTGEPGFAYDVVTGALTVADPAAFDHEEEATYTFDVTVTDADGLVTEATLTVTVLDVPEAPVFRVDEAVASVDELSVTGTLVSVLGAADDDDGDELVYEIIAGNDDGAFEIDDAGRVTVLDGTRLDFETAPVRTLDVVVTDGSGLQDAAVLTVEVGDLENFETTFTVPFLAEHRSLWDPTAAIPAVPSLHGSHTIDLNGSVDEDDAQLWNPLTGQPLQFTATSRGSIDVDFYSEVAGGEINAWLPVEVSLSLPDSIPLESEFTLGFGWTLQDDAILWGRTPELRMVSTFDFRGVGATLTVGGSTDTIPSWTALDQTVTLDDASRDFYGARFGDLFPEGLTVEDPATLNDWADFWTYTRRTFRMEEAMGNLYPRYGELLADAEPNMLIVPVVVDQGLDIPLDEAQLRRELGLPSGDRTNLYVNYSLQPLGYVDVDMTVYKSLYRFQTQTAWAFLVDVERVRATVVFENGTTVTGDAAEDLLVTLPATEDADGDGRVEMSITFDVDARLTRWFSWGAGVEWSVRVMELVAQSHRAELDPFGVPTGDYELLGDRGFGPLYSSSQSYQLASTQTTEDWLLQGFTTLPPVTGSIQVSGGP